MQPDRFKTAIILAATAFAVCGVAWAQQVQPQPQRTARGAEGTITITATVVSSVGVVIGADGQQQIIVANGADAKDSAPNLAPVKVVTMTPVPKQQADAKPASSRLQKRPD